MNNSFPDWHSGSDFGIPRRATLETCKLYMTNGVQDKKLLSIEKKRKKLNDILKNDPYRTFKSKSHTMSNVREVYGIEAKNLLDIAENNIRRKGNALGVIVYV